MSEGPIPPCSRRYACQSVEPQQDAILPDLCPQAVRREIELRPCCNVSLICSKVPTEPALSSAKIQSPLCEASCPSVLEMQVSNVADQEPSDTNSVLKAQWVGLSAEFSERWPTMAPRAAWSPMRNVWLMGVRGPHPASRTHRPQSPSPVIWSRNAMTQLWICGCQLKELWQSFN
jgi:hypothetical protein